MIMGLTSTTGMGSGKDTVAEIIKSTLVGEEVAITTYAKHLRQFLLKLLGLPSETTSQTFRATLERNNKDLPLVKLFPEACIEDDNIIINADLLMRKVKLNTRMCANIKNKLISTLKDEETTLRQALQIVGTDVVRVVCPNAWVILTEQELLKLQQNYKHIVVTDVRFPEEAKLIQKLGGEVVDIKRLNNPYIGGGVVGHPSEKALAPTLINNTIPNNSSVQDLQESVVRYLISTGLFKSEMCAEDDDEAFGEEQGSPI